MPSLLIGAAGAAVGLMIALLSNLFVLPHVLESQRRGPQSSGFLGSPERLALATTLIYRISMPLVFAFVGWIGATTLFGGEA
jgi:hypothetical protein